MTTESRLDTRQGLVVLLGAGGVSVVAGAALAVVAAVTSGSSAALSVVVGVALVVLVVGFGVLTLHVVATVMPKATVLVALVTYTLQLVVMAAVVLTLVRDGALEETLDRRWLGGGVALAAAAWMVAQIVAFARARIPVYDLPQAGAR